MLLTEKEAQTAVIFPMMQRSGDPERTCCYGSGCAMWRWSGTHIEAYVPMNGKPTLIHSDETRQGYCGLAGKPEER